MPCVVVFTVRVFSSLVLMMFIFVVLLAAAGLVWMFVKECEPTEAEYVAYRERVAAKEAAKVAAAAHCGCCHSVRN